jgi:hypothetical protein
LTQKGLSQAPAAFPPAFAIFQSLLSCCNAAKDNQYRLLRSWMASAQPVLSFTARFRLVLCFGSVSMRPMLKSTSKMGSRMSLMAPLNCTIADGRNLKNARLPEDSWESERGFRRKRERHFGEGEQFSERRDAGASIVRQCSSSSRHQKRIPS